MRPTLDELRARVVTTGRRMPRPGTWRGMAEKRLREAHDAAGRPLTRAEIRDTYPFGDRKYWPYKAWLAAVKDYRRLFPDPRTCGSCGCGPSRCRCL